ncbi:transcription factor RAX2-like [Solanum tuberosum]|nr:PREDICTED: transcription factor RAX2-like [Solanum tuberosum]
MITTCIDVCFELQEDDILREQIRIHGIDDNWTIIASNFKDKTTRQCKRRWFTYLNSDFKKGGWSPEEDMLLCAAQKIFGNRWTEIAKVVSGRTDNAVKNRFTTICKKKAKHEVVANENSTSYINLNNKRVMFSDRISDVSAPDKKLRRRNTIESSVDDCPNNNQSLRHPFAVLAQNVNNLKETYENGTFLKKNDRKINVLMQQEELLALKVNTENSNQSLENAWKVSYIFTLLIAEVVISLRKQQAVLDDFLHRMKEGDMLKFRHTEMNSGHNTHKNLITNSSSNERNRPSKRQLALSQESGGSSEYNTGSTLISHALSNKTEESQVKTCGHDQEIQSGLQKSQIGDQTGVQELENGIFCDLLFPHDLNCFILIKMMILITSDTPLVCDEMKDNDVSATAECEYPSPLQVTPQFRSLAEAIPSPKFSESERQFLLKTLEVESTSPHRTTKPPSCKRALLQSL